MKNTDRPISFLLLILFWFAPLQSLASAELDHAQRQRDIFGQLVWVEQGNAAKWFEYFYLVITVLIFAFIFAQRFKTQLSDRPHGHIGLYALTLAIMAISVFYNFSVWSAQDILRAALFVMCLVIFLRCEIPNEAIRYLQISSVILVLGLVAFSILRPEYAFSECRGDKCSPFGSLMNGFFPHENFLALVVLAVFPLIWALDNKALRYFVSASAIFLVIASSSRGVYIALGILVLFLITKKTNLISLAPPLMLLGSLVVFFSARGNDLTGRGTIYAIVWKSLLSNWALGAGDRPLMDAYQSGEITFLAYHEHGVAPYLLGRFGVFVFLLFLIILMVKGIETYRAGSRNRNLLLWLPFAAISLTFASETTIQINISSAFAWAFALYIGSEREHLRERMKGLSIQVGQE